MKHVAIIGNGAIGNVLAYQLQQAGYSFDVVLRKHTSLTLTVANNHQQQSLKIHSIAPSKLRVADVVIFPLKAYQLIDAVNMYLPFISTNTPIILLNNGLGPQQQLANHITNPLIAATTSYGAYKASPTHCMLTGQGETHAGLINTPGCATDAVISLINDTLPPCTWHHDITPFLWRKVAINAVINPLTAVNNIKNGALMAPVYQSTITDICEEVGLVMRENQLPITTHELITNVYKVIQNTADNYSSMNRDIAEKRKTEIEFINGFIVKEGKKRGIDTPINKALWHQVLALEHANQHQ